MPIAKVYIHLVWSTKNRRPFLNSLELRQKVWAHMLDNAKRKKIFIEAIGGYCDHCHCLISLGFEQCMSDVMQLLKGESSFWINKQQLCKEKFEWQDEYYAISVSIPSIKRVKDYINNQEVHHQSKTFAEEYQKILQGMNSSRDLPGGD